MDFQKKQHIHFVGIQGVAMTSLAIWAKEYGHTVSGVDVDNWFPTRDPLRQANIVPRSMGHAPSKRSDIDVVIYTGAHGGVTNPYLREFLKQGIPCLSHGRALGMIMDPFVQVAIGGSHGKTTVSAMVAMILEHSAMDPSYVVGCAGIRPSRLPGKFGKGRLFVAEADEYLTDPSSDPTPRFHWLRPSYLGITNVDYDHPDAYRDLRELQHVFEVLIGKLRKPKVCVVNADDPKSGFLRQYSSFRTVGRAKNANYSIQAIRVSPLGTSCIIEHEGEKHRVSLRVSGEHNAINAGFAAALCREIGVPWEKIIEALETFEGTKRRLEFLGEVRKIRIYDDYAHHPTEIRTTLKTLRALYKNRRIVAVFQPHTYSRTRALLSSFSQAFKSADIIGITDIFGSARESKDNSICGEVLSRAVRTNGGDATYLDTYERCSAFIKRHARPGDVAVFMGAGDIDVWARQFLSVEA